MAKDIFELWDDPNICIAVIQDTFRVSVEMPPGSEDIWVVNGCIMLVETGNEWWRVDDTKELQ